MSRLMGRAAWVLVLACAPPGAACAAAESVTFRLAPPDTLTFVETLVTAQEKTYESLGRQVDSSVTRASIHVERRGATYVFTVTPLSRTASRDGRPVADPVNDLLTGVVVTYVIGADGRIDSVRGYEDLAERIPRALPAAVAAAARPRLDRRTLTQRDVAEWNGRIGDFVGSTVTLGEWINTTTPYTLPGGEAITYATRIHFRGWEPCQAAGRTCLRIDTEFDSDAAAAPRDSAAARTASRLFGWSHRLVDPRTMLVYGEDTSRTITMTVRLPDRGDVPVTLKEERRYTYAYP